MNKNLNLSPSLLDNGIPTLFMLVGIPGSGKSQIAHEIVASADKTTKIHSSDALRKKLFGDEATQGDNNKLFAELHRRIRADLIAGNNVIYDATNIRKKTRIGFLMTLKNITCHSVCLCVMTPYENCLERNQKRDRKVPTKVIKDMLKDWQPPHYNERFDEIKYIFVDLDNEQKEKYTIDNFFKVANEFNQENSHHELTLGDHCVKAATYIQERCPDNLPLLIAAMLHDIGKLHTKTKTNAKGIKDGDCHYHQHHSYGAYECLFYLYLTGQFTEQEMAYISNLIYYHMHPYCQWKQSEKALNKDKRLLGDKLFNDIMVLHNADVYAH